MARLVMTYEHLDNLVFEVGPLIIALQLDEELLAVLNEFREIVMLHLTEFYRVSFTSTEHHPPDQFQCTGEQLGERLV